MTKSYPEKISIFERKDTEDNPKDYLPGIDERLQEVFSAKLGIISFKEGHCHGGMAIQDFSLQWYYHEWHR